MFMGKNDFDEIRINLIVDIYLLLNDQDLVFVQELENHLEENFD